MDHVLTLWALLGVDRGVHEIRYDREMFEVAHEDSKRFCRLLRGLAGQELEVSVAPIAGAIVCPVLWAKTETGRSAALLGRLRPRPTLVLGEGATHRKTALWALQRPLAFDWCQRANRRLAHALQAPKKHADPLTFRLRPPGSSLRTNRRDPVPVLVAEYNPAIYRAREIVGGLRDAPDARYRLRAAG